MASTTLATPTSKQSRLLARLSDKALGDEKKRRRAKSNREGHDSA
jgi:hypothetical protein